MEKKLDSNYARMLRAILNKSWRQHPTKQQVYGHLPPITKTILVRWTRHAEYCWRSRDELIRDILLLLYTHLQHHNDTIIKMQEDFFNKIFTSHFITRVRKGLLKVCVWEGAGDRTETAIFCPPLLRPSTLCLSRSPDAQPEALGSTLLCDGFLYSILSASSLEPNSIRAPEGPRGRVWLSLPHLVYNSISNCLELNCLDFCLDRVIY